MLAGGTKEGRLHIVLESEVARGKRRWEIKLTVRQRSSNKDNNELNKVGLTRS